MEDDPTRVARTRAAANRAQQPAPPPVPAPAPPMPPPLPAAKPVAEPPHPVQDHDDDPTRLMRQPLNAPQRTHSVQKEEPAVAPPPPSPPPVAEVEDEPTMLYRPKQSKDAAKPLSTPASAPAGKAAVSESGDPVVGWIVVINGPGRGCAIALGYGVHSVGRAEDQRIRLDFGDRGISRHQHFSITYDGRGRRFYVSQGSGSALAYLNGEPILQVHPLKATDRISLGDTELAFVPFCGEHFDWQAE